MKPSEVSAIKVGGTEAEGTWWAHYTVHNDDYTKERVRVSLGTNDVQVARALRDFLVQATPRIASNIPRVRGQAMPNVETDVCESRAVRAPWMNQPHAQSAAV